MTNKKIDTYFDPETGYALLQLDKDEVGLDEQPLDYAGKTFQPKDEVHITLLGSNVSEQLAEKMRANGGLKEKMREAIEGTDWSYTLQDEWYHVRREDGEEAESIIRMVEVPAVRAFYEQVEEIADIDIPPRPTHVTLYTWNDPDGIGIATREQFRERVVSQIEPEQLAEK